LISARNSCLVTITVRSPSRQLSERKREREGGVRKGGEGRRAQMKKEKGEEIKQRALELKILTYSLAGPCFVVCRTKHIKHLNTSLHTHISTMYTPTPA
jgi:hypothetical protein